MKEGISFNRAFEIASQTFSYTNHTVMAEALEKWDVSLFKSVLPEVFSTSSIRSTPSSAENSWRGKHGLLEDVHHSGQDDPHGKPCGLLLAVYQRRCGAAHGDSQKRRSQGLVRNLSRSASRTRQTVLPSAAGWGSAIRSSARFWTPESAKGTLAISTAFPRCGNTFRTRTLQSSTKSSASKRQQLSKL